MSVHSYPTPDPAKIHSLHGLRGVMAWWVVLGHISLAFGWNLLLIDQNTLPVDVFILLSGFVIAMLRDRKQEQFDDYITRRAFRLFPLYLIVLSVSTLLLPVQLGAWRALAPSPVNLGRIQLVQSAMDALWAHLVVHATLLQGLPLRALAHQVPFTLVGQAWSISLEWQFYIVAPLLIAAMTSRNLFKLAATAVAVLVLAYVARWFSDAFLGARILHFVIGIASYFAVKGKDRRAWIAVCAMVGLLVLYHYGVGQAVPLLIWSAILWSSVQPAHSIGHRLASLMGSRPAFHMGEISYSIYLLHMIPLYGSIFLLDHVGIRGAELQAIAALATIVVTYAAANLAYRWVEKPGIEMGSRLVGGKLAPTAQLAS